MLALAGILGGTAQLCMTASLRFAQVATVAPFDYLQIIWATGIGWLAFTDRPGGATLVGAALIAGGGIYTALHERRLRRAPAGLPASKAS